MKFLETLTFVLLWPFVVRNDYVFVSVIFSMRDHAVLYMRFCSGVYLAHVTTIL